MVAVAYFSANYLAFRNTGYPSVHHQHRAVVLVTSLLLEHGATRVLEKDAYYDQLTRHGSLLTKKIYQ